MTKPEERLHLAVADFLRVALISPTFWSSIDHGAGKLSKRAAGMAKARGVKAGLPDVWVISPNVLPPFTASYPRVLAIELKTATGKLSPAQKETIFALMAAGVRCYVARSVDEVEEILRLNGVVLRARVRVRAAA